MIAKHPQAPDFSASLADARCCLTIIAAPDTSQADREVAALALSTAADDLFDALTSAPYIIGGDDEAAVDFHLRLP